MSTHTNSQIRVLSSTFLTRSSEILMHGSNLLKRAGLKIYQPYREETLCRWFREKGDQTYRLNYELDNSSVVFDLGGYEGQWSSDIFAKYCCFIHIFEPVVDFADFIERRFAKNDKIFIHRFGLSDENHAIQISVDGNKSSVFGKQLNTRVCQLMRAIDFMDSHNIKHIDLMKINIEGGEYSLLEHTIESGFVKNIKNIQVQFHDFVPDAELRMTQIQDQLSQTHHLTYQYPFIW